MALSVDENAIVAGIYAPVQQFEPQDAIYVNTASSRHDFVNVDRQRNSARYPFPGFQNFNLTVQQRRRRQVVIVAACTLLTFTGCGFNFAFGVYQEHYEILGGPFENASPGSIDLIGILAASLMTIGAPIAGSWSKAYSARSVTMLGGILFAVAGMSASFGTRLWQFQITQGAIQGCAACLAYIPAVTISPGFFDSRRALAMGIILSGTGLGGMAWAPLIRYLIDVVGFRVTLVTMGLVASAIISSCAMALPTGNEPRTPISAIESKKQAGPKPEWQQIKTKAFLAHASGGVLHSSAYFLPIYYMSSLARHLGYSHDTGAHLIALSNLCNCLGKIIIGHLADRSGRFNAIIFATGTSAIATLAMWATITSNANADVQRFFLVFYAIVYGLTSGSYVSLFPTTLVEQFGIEGFANISGVLYMIRGIGTLLGMSIGSATMGVRTGPLQSSDAFSGLFLFSGACLAGASISMAGAKTSMTAEGYA